MKMHINSPLRGISLFTLAMASLCLAQSVTTPPLIPIIPPSVTAISPAGMQRGTVSNFTLEGRNLSDATEILFDAPGMIGKISEIKDVPEKIEPPKAGEDLGAQVPLGRKQTAALAITVAKDAIPGIHRFRIKTPLGTTNTAAVAIGALPEIKAHSAATMDSPSGPVWVTLPATLIGEIASPGDKDEYKFSAKSGYEAVFQVQASRLGSSLKSMLVLRNSSGQIVAESGNNETTPDAALHCQLSNDGEYTLSITDRNHEGGRNYFYRVDAGPLPYITSFFPLGVRAGKSSDISVKGFNLGSAREVKVEAPDSSDGWNLIALAVNGIHPVNEPKLAVGSEPEVLEQEPNNSITQAQVLTLPITVNGHIDGGVQASGTPDEDYFRFHGNKGQQLSIDVAAARLGSALDSVIEVLDARGNPIPRATIRCLNQTTTTLSDRDSRSLGIRLVSTSGLREGDYLMIGDELNRIDFIPDQPDYDTNMKGIDDLRLAYLGTSPDVHAVNTPVVLATEPTRSSISLHPRMEITSCT